jgi:hypothetical protein
MAKAKIMNYRGFQHVFCKETGYAPYFTNMILYRIKKKMATNVVIVGEAGVGKSYMAIDLCRVVAGKTKTGQDRFSIDQVVFTYKQFMELVLKLKPGKAIVFDEPSYAMGKRQWYKQLNQALVQTIESFRYKVHPLFIPIINASLLDKTVRDHLIQYKVVMSDRGKAEVYRINASHFTDKVYHNSFCGLQYGLFDKYKCDKPSCLECPKLMKKDANGKYVCNIFRAQYERKKGSIQEDRYEQARNLAEQMESTQLTMKQIEGLSLTVKDKWLLEDKIDVQALRIALEDEYGIRVSNNKAYNLKRRLELHYPNLIVV